MANIEKKQQRQQLRPMPTARAAGTGAAASTPQAATAAATNPAMQGVSQNTQNNLNQYSAGYTPSATVNQAQQYLNNVLGGRPGAYQSAYAGDLSSLYNQIMNQPDFTFDINGNALYQMYSDLYTNQGRNAMMDAMGQAAAMTGGYGNSYASTAGNQAFQQYLQQLSAVIPQIYEMEYDRYNNDRNHLLQQYGIVSDADSEAYGRWSDSYNQWLNEYGLAQDAYNSAYSQDYGAWSDALNYWQNAAQNENSAFFNQQQFDAQQAADNRQYAYQQAMAILQAGNMPSAALLAAAGISQQDANSLRRRRSSSSSSSSSSANRPQNAQQPSSGDTYDSLAYAASHANTASGRNAVSDRIESAYAAGNITYAQATQLLNAIDPDVRNTYTPGSYTSSVSGARPNQIHSVR